MDSVVGLYYTEDDWATPALVGLYDSPVAALFGEWAYSLEQKKKEIAYQNEMREILSPAEFQEYVDSRESYPLGEPKFSRKVLYIKSASDAKKDFVQARKL